MHFRWSNYFLKPWYSIPSDQNTFKPWNSNRVTKLIFMRFKKCFHGTKYFFSAVLEVILIFPEHKTLFPVTKLFLFYLHSSTCLVIKLMMSDLTTTPTSVSKKLLIQLPEHQQLLDKQLHSQRVSYPHRLLIISAAVNHASDVLTCSTCFTILCTAVPHPPRYLVSYHSNMLYFIS